MATGPADFFAGCGSAACRCLVAGRVDDGADLWAFGLAAGTGACEGCGLVAGVVGAVKVSLPQTPRVARRAETISAKPRRASSTGRGTAIATLYRHPAR